MALLFLGLPSPQDMQLGLAQTRLMPDTTLAPNLPLHLGNHPNLQWTSFCCTRVSRSVTLRIGLISSNSNSSNSFFSCNAGLVLDMVGQLLEMVKTDLKSPWCRSKRQTRNQHPQNKPTTTPQATPTHQRKPRNRSTPPGRFVN